MLKRYMTRARSTSAQKSAINELKMQQTIILRFLNTFTIRMMRRVRTNRKTRRMRMEVPTPRAPPTNSSAMEDRTITASKTFHAWSLPKKKRRRSARIRMASSMTKADAKKRLIAWNMGSSCCGGFSNAPAMLELTSMPMASVFAKMRAPQHILNLRPPASCDQQFETVLVCITPSLVALLWGLFLAFSSWMAQGLVDRPSGAIHLLSTPLDGDFPASSATSGTASVGISGGPSSATKLSDFDGPTASS
mmetsp:Transcript_31049/g.85018  ORF Transcript_31049/g.85018 Transcript_31049/m.85018 type:complete len:249 (+) Transcript_31049:910-1656(+)